MMDSRYCGRSTGPLATTSCDRVPDEPGAEMQHDTSPYRLKLAGQWTAVIASLLYLRYSKRRYLKFYRTFNRFLMKCFLHEALMFWGYAAPWCIIDNTNLARLPSYTTELSKISKSYATNLQQMA